MAKKKNGAAASATEAPAKKSKASAAPPPPVEEAAPPPVEEAAQPAPAAEGAAPTARPEKPVEAVEWDVLYPEPTCELCLGDTAITVDKAKDLLGWEEEEEDGPTFGEFYTKELAKAYGRKVRLKFNVANRPIYPDVFMRLRQEHLNRRWQFNGEPIIIGRCGHVLNGQHTLISLILAEQERTGPRAQHWSLYHDKPITMDKAIMYGVSEEDSVVNTMDTCKPRSLADVIYRSPYFATKKATDRKMAAKVLEFAIKLLWARTGAQGNQNFPTYQTHAESLDFLARHDGPDNRLLRCVDHIMRENGDGAISKFISPGYASGMMYLMAASGSDKEVYMNTVPHTADVLNWDYWDLAAEFFSRLISNETFHEVRMHLNTLGKSDMHERAAVLCKAWNVFIQDNNAYVPALAIRVEQHFDEDGSRVWDEYPDVGGIDLGPKKPSERTRAAKAAADSAAPVTEQEVEEAKERIRQENLARKAAQPAAPEEEEEEEEDDYIDEEESEAEVEEVAATEDQGDQPSESSEEAEPVRPGTRVERPAPGAGGNAAAAATGWKPPPAAGGRKAGNRGPR